MNKKILSFIQFIKRISDFCVVNREETARLAKPIIWSNTVAWVVLGTRKRSPYYCNQCLYIELLVTCTDPYFNLILI